MGQLSRREWIAGVGGTAVAVGGRTPALKGAAASASSQTQCDLALVDYQPKSMLHVKETSVPVSKYPVIDFHTHLSFTRRGKDRKPVASYEITPEQALEVMDRRNIRIMVNLTGGNGPVLEENLDYWQRPHPERFLVFTEPMWDRASDAGYSRMQAEEVEKAAKMGVKGIKVLKTLGLYLREGGAGGPLVKVDDPRFDEMWEAAGSAKMPIAIHTSDPEAFFLPTDRVNERFEELNAHPDWSFHGSDFPSDRELQEARMRVIRRHPKTNFVALHVANAENLDYVSECMDECSNMYVEIGARIGELGRQPRRSMKFFDKYQDRILFGTDAVPNGYETPQQIFGDRLYEIYYRFLETDDEYFDYAPADVPPQGRWRIYGVDLSDSILRKVYFDNAAKLLGLAPLGA